MMAPLIFAICVAMAIISLTHQLYRWWNPTCKTGKLPPGSMGWPIFGESIGFLSNTTTFEMFPFIKQRTERYGPIFRTSLWGKQTIVSTDPDLNFFILRNEDQFPSVNPEQYEKLFGPGNIGATYGSLHKYLKNMVLSLFGPENLKKMVPQVEESVNRELERWADQEEVELKEACSRMIFKFTSRKLISLDSEKSAQSLKSNYDAFIRGLIALPINIPGTVYYECLQGRNRVTKVLWNMLRERKRNPRMENTDFFDYVLEELSKQGTAFTEEMAVNFIYSVIFASYDTTSMTSTLAIKFLTDNPSALKRLTEEHEAIIRNRENKDSGLSWKEYKSMTFTFQVISETLRLVSLVGVLFRKATKDVNFRGYTIPEGWQVVLCPQGANLNPSEYENPLEFNPWRWDGAEIPNSTKKFMAFGGGIRLCAGVDFARLQIAVFLHCMVTKYRWDAVKGGNITRGPGVNLPDGYHIQFFEKNAADGRAMK